MFAAPNASDVEAQRALQQQQGTDYSKTTITTTTTTVPNPAQQSGGLVMMSQRTPAQQPAPQQSGGQTGGEAAEAKKGTLSRMAHSMEWGALMLLLAYFSMILMIAASQVCSADDPVCLGTRGYQVAIGTISLIIAAVAGFLSYLGYFGNRIAQLSVSVLLFLWWTAGIIVLTFISDFQFTTRAAGYFSSWASFIITMLALISLSADFETELNTALTSIRKPLFVLAVASLVVMGAAIGPCSPRNNCNGYSAYAIVVSVASGVFAIILFFLPGMFERKTMVFVAWAFIIWWVFGLAVTTLGGPFLVAGNGFFGTYAALFASAYLLHNLRSPNY